MFNIFKNKKENNENIKGKISLWSYQRFCSFYNYTVFVEPNFENEIKKILELIEEKKERNIKTIAKESGCSIQSCIFKIRYLKNKRWLDEKFYVDSHSDEIKECSEEDINLIDKYYEMVYQKNYSIDEIVKELSKNSELEVPKELIKEKAYEELKYLSDNSLINGIKIDEEKHDLIYYKVEKRKKSETFVTLNCPNCGALVDIPKREQGRCSYCKTIVEDTYTK